MKKGIASAVLVVAVVALAGCGLPDLTAPAERPVKSVARRHQTPTTTTTLLSDWDLRPTTTAVAEPDTTTTVAPADATNAPGASSAGVAGNAPVAPSPNSSPSPSLGGGTTTMPASANQPTPGTPAGGDTGTCAYPGRCTSDPHRNGEVGCSGQVAGTTATPVGAGGE